MCVLFFASCSIRSGAAGNIFMRLDNCARSSANGSCGVARWHVSVGVVVNGLLVVRYRWIVGDHVSGCGRHHGAAGSGDVRSGEVVVTRVGWYTRQI